MLSVLGTLSLLFIMYNAHRVWRKVSQLLFLQ